MNEVYEIYEPKDWETNEVIDEHELDHIENGIHQASIQINKNVGDINTLRNDVDGVSEDLVDAKARISSLDSDVEQLGQAVASTADSIESLESDVNDLDTRVDALEQSGSLPALEIRVAAVEHSVSDIQDSITWDVQHND